MNLAPALTWLQLFPRGIGVACDTGPSWFAHLLGRRTGVNEEIPPKLLAVWEKKWAELADLPRWDGLAAINCRDISNAKLESAGFTYVRRFAIIPNLQNPRWFISLDSPRAAAASFNLYTPARASARIKRKAAKWAALMRLPIWYRDQIVIASRQPPPLERKLSQLFPGTQLRLGLSAGAPEPARNRKASGAIMAPDGTIVGFVKIAGSDISRGIMEHEVEILTALADRTRLKFSAPKLLFAGEVDGRFLTVQTPLAGGPAVAKMTPAHLRFLESLRSGEIKPAGSTRMVTMLRDRIAALPEAHPELTATLEQFLPTLESTQVPSTIVHGDFAPWNLRIHRGTISAFDWEYGELDGLPLIDETHYTLQLGYLLNNWDFDRAHRCLLDLAASKPMGLAAEQVQAIQAMYLLDNIVRLFGEGYDGEHDMVLWYRQLLDRIETTARERQAVLV
jgi:hypothetical protein